MKITNNYWYFSLNISLYKYKRIYIYIYIYIEINEYQDKYIDIIFMSNSFKNKVINLVNSDKDYLIQVLLN